MWRLLWKIYLWVGILTFLLYGLDKFLAKAGWKRIPERWFHTLTLLGGFGGALIGMHMFNHKKRKHSFRWVILAAFLLHGAAVVIVMARLAWF
ncbi:MAG: DUF1294 domain-containing protein [Opitutales bacterium]|jgi:uncharacterized membrane protein YsdA (DUF1294 family)|nr:DUF1294 domain-containing protein [Opitutales bacterium]MDG2168303.1 DUF1294 domain-containing protein [Opitutales bacterium]|tara:strand:+ start:229 stop:507 length:279 start_codon:yes stop_codon:yes gene_type:complete